MYKYFLRPIFFAFDPEWVHYFTLNFLKLIFKVPILKTFTKWIYQRQFPDLEKELLEFKNFGKKSADEVSKSLHKRFNIQLS